MFFKVVDKNGNAVFINLNLVASIKYIRGGKFSGTAFCSADNNNIYLIKQDEDKHEFLIQRIEDLGCSL
jgi:hypothetical protein